MRPLLIFLGILAFVLPHRVAADEATLQRPKDPDTIRVVTHCASICHSIDYIQMNSPFLKRAQWEAEVKKMTKVFGAPIGDDDATQIVNYLVHYYGVE